jgi:hypothetical protein
MKTTEQERSAVDHVASWKTPVVVSLVGLAAMCSSCVWWEQSDHRLVRGTPEIDPLCGQSREAHVTAATMALQAHLGLPFPNLTLLDKHGAVTRLNTLRAGRTAVLFACCPGDESVAWLRECEALRWAPPPGYDRLVVLTMGFGEDAFDALARKAPAVFFVGWPLEDYLAQVRVAPILFGVSATGTLEGYWLFENRKQIAATRPNMQPNYGVNAPVRSVTPLAESASVAPVRPARYALR